LNELLATGSWPVVVFATLAVFTAGAVRGYVGFGFSALTVASISLVLPMASVVPVVIMLEVAASVLQLRSVWQHVLPADIVRAAVLVVILIACVLLVHGYQMKGPQPLWRLGAVGIVAGAVNGAGAVGGLVYSLFMVADGVPPAQFRASLVLLFLLVDALSAGIMFRTGLLVPSHGSLWLLLLVPMAVGLALGSRIFATTNPQSFRRFAIGLLLCLSIVGLLTVAYGAVSRGSLA